MGQQAGRRGQKAWLEGRNRAGRSPPGCRRRQPQGALSANAAGGRASIPHGSPASTAQCRHGATLLAQRRYGAAEPPLHVPIQHRRTWTWVTMSAILNWVACKGEGKGGVAPAAAPAAASTAALAIPHQQPLCAVCSTWLSHARQLSWRPPTHLERSDGGAKLLALVHVVPGGVQAELRSAQAAPQAGGRRGGRVVGLLRRWRQYLEADRSRVHAVGWCRTGRRSAAFRSRHCQQQRSACGSWCGGPCPPRLPCGHLQAAMLTRPPSSAHMAILKPSPSCKRRATSAGVPMWGT